MLMACALAGCSHSTIATAPPANTSPAATSPQGAVKLFEWAMGHANVDVIAGMLPDDFVIIGAGVDSAGGPSPTDTLTVSGRSWFLGALSSMIKGVPGLYEPAQVSLRLDQNFVPLPDSRPGRDPRFHKQIRTSFDLRVLDTNVGFEASGNVLLFATRGDSVTIPPELFARGVKPDSTTWWLDRLEDETLAGPSPPLPAKNISLLQLLDYYYKRLTP